MKGLSSDDSDSPGIEDERAVAGRGVEQRDSVSAVGQPAQLSTFFKAQQLILASPYPSNRIPKSVKTDSSSLQTGVIYCILFRLLL